MAEWTEAFKELTAKTHTEQGIWWLNGFWKDGASDYAEQMWDEVHLMIELQCGQPKLYGSKAKQVDEGSDLDDFKAHHFLEKLGNTMTVMELRKTLKALDIDNNKKMSLSEYLLSKHAKTPTALVESPQGGQAEQAQLDAAKEAVDKSSAMLNAAVADAEASAAAAATAKEALEAAETAEKELNAAVAELEAQEKALSDKKSGFQAKIDNESLSAMKRNMAKNELAQVEAEDPMPLRKAKITQKAALKKSQKARTKANGEKEKADAAATAAQQALADAEAAFADASEKLNTLKKKGDGIAQGAVWWMERELAERRKFMPKGK